MPHNPFSYAHTLVGVGCMVVNAQDEVLVVQVGHCSGQGSSGFAPDTGTDFPLRCPAFYLPTKKSIEHII